MELGPLPGKVAGQYLGWLKTEFFTWYSRRITYNRPW